LPDRWTHIASPTHLSDGTVIDTHLPALLVIEHRAWWPYLFDNLSQQPIRKREPYRNAAETIDHSADPIALLLKDDPRLAPITHVLVRGPVPAEAATPALRLLAGDGETSFFAVVRGEIRPTQPNAPPPPR
jgi:hypothetical protein